MLGWYLDEGPIEERILNACTLVAREMWRVRCSGVIDGAGWRSTGWHGELITINVWPDYQIQCEPLRRPTSHAYCARDNGRESKPSKIASLSCGVTTGGITIAIEITSSQRITPTRIPLEGS